jgi:hypothetical protein
VSELPVESAPEVSESPALPKPTVSPPSEVKPPSPSLDVGELASRLKSDLLPELKSYIDRSNQSIKDRRIAGLEQQFDKLKSYLDASGGDPKRAAREMAVDDLLSERQEQPANQGKVGEDWEGGVQRILREAEEAAGIKVSPDDPELRAVAGGTYSSWSEAYAAVNRVVLRRARGVPAPVAEIRGMTSTTTPTVDDLTNKVNQLIAVGAPTEALLSAKKELLEAVSKK